MKHTNTANEHKLSCFKAYDIRGRVPDELNPALARRIGRAYAEAIRPRAVAVGRDVRLSSPALLAALSDGLMAGGCDVHDLGLCGTEEIYCAANLALDGGLMVTASHNPMDYNGIKLVRKKARPISGDSGLWDIEALVAGSELPDAHRRGKWFDKAAHYREYYIEELCRQIEINPLCRPLRIVTNAGNGGAGPIIDRLDKVLLPFQFIRIHHEPDGNFPNGIPNPLLPERRAATSEAVIAHQADFGVAWDGDFDRCFLFDENGRFIEGYYIVGLLAKRLLDLYPGNRRIIHDPRLTWNTIELVEAAGGIPIQSKTGHAFIKERMRQEDALYGGEMSAHHYFREFFYCDSGMIPWLLIAELLFETRRPLSSWVDERMAAFPCSGEINFRVDNPAEVLARIEAQYREQASIDRTDGLSMEFTDWRFNIRSSNTEPLLRLNVETRADQGLLEQRTEELRRFIGADH